MDKKEIIKELNNYVKDIYSDFSVELWFKTDIVLVFCDLNIAAFNEFDPNNFTISEMSEDIASTIVETGIIYKFYKKTCELLDKQIDKYTVRITNGTESYLHANSMVDYKDVCFDNLINYSSAWVNKFTKEEIESFKKRDDLAIDWDKAIIEKVEE